MNYLILISLISFISVAQERCNSFNEGEKLATQKEYKASNSVANISINDQHLGPMRDQGDTGYCYAYSAADLLEHYYKKNGKLKKNESISALGIALIDQSDAWKERNKEFENKAGDRKFNKDIIDKSLKKSNAIAKEAGRNVFNFLSDLGKGRGRSSFSSAVIKGTNSLINDLKPLSEKFNQTKKGEEYWREDSLVKRESIPEGGDVYDAAQELLNKMSICLESEVSSRDEGLRQLFEESDSMFRTTESSSFSEALGQLALAPHGLANGASQSEMCSVLNVITVVFPKTSIRTLEDLTTFIKGGKSKDGKTIKAKKSTDEFIAGLVKHHCKNESVSRGDIPNVAVLGLSKKIKQDDLTNKIEAILSKGDVIEISYHANALFSEKEETYIDDFHSSLIVGSLDICNEPYYVLRNSWGKQSCNTQMAQYTETYIEENNDKEQVSSIQEKFNTCKNMGDKQIDENLKPEEREAIRSKVFKKCLEDRARSLSEKHSPPYFCDQNGNYIIKKDYLKKNLRNVSYIEEVTWEYDAEN